MSRERLEHKKRGAREGPPFFFRGVAGLKVESNAELQLPHAVRSIRRSIRFDVCDLSATSAVDTGVALRRAETKYRVVEHVVRIKAELRFVFFRNVECLG